jgi:aerobic-type carbon monoxide dehydrogenase small subunit (CoxS/CutS family)
VTQKERIAFTLNGMPVEVRADPMQRLADVLVRDVGLPGLTVNCSTGDCGSCTVSVDGRLLAACLVAVALVEGSEVATVDA